MPENFMENILASSIVFLVFLAVIGASSPCSTGAA